jgi:hypothetical protein
MSRIVSLRNGRFDPTGHADLKEAFNQWDPGARRLVVHFHGGLVSHEAGLRIAQRLQPLYEQAGGYPLFVLWRSSLGEIVVDDLRAIADEKIFQRLLSRVVQFVTGKLREEKTGSRGLTVDLPILPEVNAALRSETGEEPYAELTARPEPLTRPEEEQLRAALGADPVVLSEAAKIAAWLSEDAAPAGRERAAVAAEVAPTKISSEVIEEIRGADTGERAVVTTARIVKGAVATVARTLQRLRSGRDHGVYTTAVEELLREFYLAAAGRLVWREMKKDIAAAFGEDAGASGGTAILRELSARSGSATPPVLVGHSAGAIYICNFLSHADAALPPGLQFDVAMLAPACDFGLMDETLARHGQRVRRLRIFAMKDELEKKDRLLSRVYCRSLLYLVSGLFEKEADWPLVGMERFHRPGPPFGEGGFPEIERVCSAVRSKPDSTVWSIASGSSGLESSATRHGAFDDDEVTLASVCRFIETG